jgi:hypothetical protein
MIENIIIMESSHCSRKTSVLLFISLNTLLNHTFHFHLTSFVKGILKTALKKLTISSAVFVQCILTTANALSIFYKEEVTLILFHDKMHIDLITYETSMLLFLSV